MNSRRTWSTIALLSCLLIGGCSSKLMYNFLDWWLVWNVKSYLDLNSDQRGQLKQQAKTFHAWHRNSELPRYSEFLLTAKLRLSEGPVSAPELEVFAEDLNKLWRNSLSELVVPAAQLVASLSDRQADKFLDTLQDKQDEFRQDYVELTREELIEQRTDTMEEMLKDWTGRLQPSQIAKVEQWAKRMLPNRELMLTERQRWRARLKELLKRRTDSDFDDQLRSLIYYPEGDWSEDYRQNVRDNQALTLELIADINNSLTDKQKRKRDRRLQKYIDDLQSLTRADLAIPAATAPLALR